MEDRRIIMIAIVILVPLVITCLPGWLYAQEVSPRPLEPVPTVDLVRYAGTWFEIARLPNRFQKGCISDVTATYSLLDDGQILVINRCRTSTGEMKEAEGKARRKGEDEPTSKLLVRFAPAILSFLPFVWADYWVIDLAEDYSYAVVGEPSREYLWILARSPVLDEQTYEAIAGRLRQQGYDPTLLVRTSHGR
jgi:apolipoprotein D and lipocalin family protein